MAANKTLPTKESVPKFIAAIDDPVRRADAKELVAMMREITGERPVLWGSSMIGFGSYSYTYSSGHSGDWPRVAFAPRKGSTVLYVMARLEGHETLLQKLGPHKRGVGCVYIQRLDDVSRPALKKLIAFSARNAGR